jgi:hypothetical protein
MKVVGIIFTFLTALSSLNSNKWLEISHQISAAVSVFSIAQLSVYLNLTNLKDGLTNMV